MLLSVSHNGTCIHSTGLFQSLSPFSRFYRVNSFWESRLQFPVLNAPSCFNIIVMNRFSTTEQHRTTLAIVFVVTELS